MTAPESRKQESLGDAVASAARILDGDQRPKPPEPRGPTDGRRRLIAVAAIVASVALVLLKGGSFARPKPDPIEVSRGLAQSFLIAHQRVFAFWDSTGRLPTVLTEVGPRQPSIGYSVRDGHFRLAFKKPEGDSVMIGFTKAFRGGFWDP